LSLLLLSLGRFPLRAHNTFVVTTTVRCTLPQTSGLHNRLGLESYCDFSSVKSHCRSKKKEKEMAACWEIFYNFTLPNLKKKKDLKSI